MNEDNFISIIKTILMESLDFSEQITFNPELYYFITLFILNNQFEFYSEDIFKFFILKGYSYFKSDLINKNDKLYLKLFEEEIQSWDASIPYSDFEELITEILKNDKPEIVLSLKNKKINTKNIEKHINTVAKEIHKKYKNKNIAFSNEDIIEKLFDLF